MTTREQLDEMAEHLSGTLQYIRELIVLAANELNEYQERHDIDSQPADDAMTCLGEAGFQVRSAAAHFALAHQFPDLAPKVEWRGRDLWAVCRRRWTLGRHGEWEFESSPSGREEQYLQEHRHTLDEALRLAREALPPTVRINGHHALDLPDSRGEASTDAR